MLPVHGIVRLGWLLAAAVVAAAAAVAAPEPPEPSIAGFSSAQLQKSSRADRIDRRRAVVWYPNLETNRLFIL